ncbi:DNA adenine methylase [Streptomyces sp. bgisy029]|uniref:DNA adenine methylase n=1 Tax=Streptomyces sp. bgisy029 TaxID=3413771 RepID=UPI003D72026F
MRISAAASAQRSKSARYSINRTTSAAQGSLASKYSTNSGSTFVKQEAIIAHVMNIPNFTETETDGFLTVTPAKLPALANVPHPFPYQGSKRALAHAVLRFLPSDTGALVEPFAGSAAISIASRYAHMTSQVVMCDINEPLMAMWQRIIDDPTGLADEYEAMWNESLDDPKGFFLKKRLEFNEALNPAILLYLLNRIVKGAVRYAKNGAFNQSADNRRLGAKPVTVRDRLARTSKVMQGTTVHSGSYESLLIEASEVDVVYMDPPYQGVTNVADHRYMAGLARDDFERALRKANANGVSYIVSYDAVRPDNKYGEALSADLELTHLHLLAGRSAQSTLSGGTEVTVESLYLSPALVQRLGGAKSLVA